MDKPVGRVVVAPTGFALELVCLAAPLPDPDSEPKTNYCCIGAERETITSECMSEMLRSFPAYICWVGGPPIHTSRLVFAGSIEVYRDDTVVLRRLSSDAILF